MTPDPCSRLFQRLRRPSLGLGLGLSLSGGGGRFNPVNLFAGGVKGLIWDFSVPTSLYSDAGTTPAVIDGAIGRIIDQSPNGVQGNQTTAGSKPLWKTSGGKYYALFDGSDDGLVTPAIDFSGTDKVTVFVGVRKLSDVAIGMIVELSATVSSNNGSFWLAGPINPGVGDYNFTSKGTTNKGETRGGHVAPITSVLTCIGDISAPSAGLRVNGIDGAPNVTTQGTGNYGNYPVYVGRRAGATLPFNGQIFCLIIVGRACTATEIAATEAWINTRTGAY